MIWKIVCSGCVAFISLALQRYVSISSDHWSQNDRFKLVLSAEKQKISFMDAYELGTGLTYLSAALAYLIFLPD